MSLVYNTTRSGLIVASEGSDEKSVRRALKQHDDALTLTPDLDEGRVVWTVMKRVGDSRHVVCRWRDEHGNPLPLSHGLVDYVKSLDLNSRRPLVDVEAENDRHQEAIRAADAEELEWYGAEITKALRGKSGAILPRGRYRRNTVGREITDIR